MKPILEAGRNCERIAEVGASGVLIDARDYYLAVHAAILRAERYVLMAGWQFDSGVALVRGDDARRVPGPVRLLELIEHAAAARPELEFYLLAWDYSLVFVHEREWMQRLKFDWTTSERIHFVFDDQHPVGGSHHQKLVVVDGAIAFAGGIDVCESRWDDRRHAVANAERVNRVGAPQKPYHDLMAYCTGPAVAELARLFCERWQRATDDALRLPLPASGAPLELSGALPIEARAIAVSLTLGAHEGSLTPQVEQIKRLHEDAIASAQQLIYIETQYFTSRAVHAALCARMKAQGTKLEIALMMPKGADTPKENFALGGAQDWVLSSLAVTAAEHGHALIVLYSAASDEAGQPVATFIHSKVLAVDDRLLTVGSANCTNRSMSLDSELNVAWESSAPGDAVARGIARVRASLLCEHAGIDYDPSLAQTSGLVARLDAMCGPTRLRRRDVPASPAHVEQDPLLERAFDPETDLTKLELDEILEPRRD